MTAAVTGTTVNTRLLAGRRGLLFVSILFVNFVVWLDSAKFSLLNPYWSADLHLSTSQISSVSASYLLGYFPVLLVAGVLADWLGAKRMLTICIIGVTLLSGSMAFVHTYTEMYWRNFVFGIFFGFLWAPCTRLLAMWFPGSLGARATSVWMSSTLVASVIAPAIALPIAHHASWQDAFLVVAALGVPAFILLVLFTADKPERLRGITAEEAEQIVVAQAEAAGHERISLMQILRLLKNRSILIMIVATGLATTPTWLSGTWVPYGLITLNHTNPDTIAWVSPILAIFPVAFGLINGSIVNRVFGGRTKPMLALGPLCGAIGYGMGIVLHDSNWVIWGFMISAFAFLTDPMFWGTVNSYWAGIASPAATGTLNGISAALQVGVGWFITDQSGHWLDHSAAGRGQLDRVWLVGAIMFAVAIIPVLLCREIRVGEAPTTAADVTPVRAPDPTTVPESAFPAMGSPM